jgi:hypothetical protein
VQQYIIRTKEQVLNQGLERAWVQDGVQNEQQKMHNIL